MPASGQRSLWKHPDFLKVWMGETVSLFGTQITTLALPLTAVLLLKASPQEMGLLTAAGFAPFLLVTLFAGVWLDRTRKRGVMIGANLGRGLLLALIPLLIALDVLHMAHLLAIVFAIGTLNILFELAYQSYLPALLPRAQLQDGNSKLFASASVAEIGGPGMAGWLIELLSAPLALFGNALAALFAGFTLLLVRAREPLPEPPAPAESVGRQIRAGLRLTLRNPYLRAFVGEAASYNFFNQAFITLYVLYATEQLHLSPGTIGLIFAAGSVGALLGSILTVPVARRIGIGRAIQFGALPACIAPLAIPLANGPLLLVVLAAAQFVTAFGIAFVSVHTFSIRQAIVPERLRGRMTASYRFISWGVLPFGSFLAGSIAQHIGVQPTLLLGAFGLMLTAAWFFQPAISTLRAMPPVIEERVEPVAVVPALARPDISAG